MTKARAWTHENVVELQKANTRAQLTDVAIRAIAPGKKRKYYGAGRGLWLEVFPSGVMSWRYRYRLNGRAEKVAIGKYPQISLKEARQKRDELAVMVAHGESPAAQKQLAKMALAPTTTVRDFGERFFREVVVKSRKDTSIPRRYLDVEVYPAFGHKRLSEVTATEIQSVIFRKRDKGFPAAAIVIRSLLKRMFDYAIVCGAAATNPTLATPTRFISKARPRTRALTDAEIKIYLHIVYASGIRTQFKLALHVILLTLVRKSELLFSKWTHIDFDRNEWNIPAEISKNKRPHVVFLSKQVAGMFRELKTLAGKSQWVLPGRSRKDKPFAKNALNKALEGLSFGILPFTIHDLRRTSSTRLNEMGFAADVIEKALNHEIGGVRGIYNKAAYAEQRREMLQRWADHVSSLVPALQFISPGIDNDDTIKESR